MYCVNCGKQLDADARFCPECGTAVNGEPAPWKKKNKLWLGIVFAVILAGIVVGHLRQTPANPAPSAEYTALLERFGFEDYSVYESSRKTIAFLETQEDGSIWKTEFLIEDGHAVKEMWYFFCPHSRTLEEQKRVLAEMDEEDDGMTFEAFEGYYVMIVESSSRFFDHFDEPHEIAEAYLEAGAIQR